ncbi:MAG: DMT family transporter [Gemmatimonadetes bacterium]|nr:DMT family transporter [Gemmatimonadota bacterium]
MKGGGGPESGQGCPVEPGASPSPGVGRTRHAGPDRLRARPGGPILPGVSHTAVFTGLALLAFAANSLLCRLALSTGAIDPASFTGVRLLTGAAALALLARPRTSPAAGAEPSWASAAMLFLYAVPFSYAYVSLGAATGALLLFGAVQLTMILGAVRRGHHPTAGEWAGLALAFGGLVYLLLPGFTAPPPLGAALMLLAGAAWGVYSLRGHRVQNPLAQTASNFARTTPMVAALGLAAAPTLHLEVRGVLLAALSGAVASGLGYVAWYRALPALRGVIASVVQLAVPVLAAGGGVLLLGERITPRLVLASLAVLGGIGWALLARPRPAAVARE